MTTTQSEPAGLLSYQRLLAPIDIAALVFFRLVFAGSMLNEVLSHFKDGLIDIYFVLPDFHFKFYGFGWVNPLSGTGMHAVFWVMGICSVLVLFGAFYRVAATVLCVSFTYVFLLEEALYRNHYYLLCLIAFLMIFLPANRALAVDCWLRPKIKSATVPAWTLWILRFQLTVVYFYAGLAKIYPDWLTGDAIRAMLTTSPYFPQHRELMSAEWLIQLVTWSGLLFDLAIGPALLWRRTRVIAFLFAAAFHLTNAQLLFDIGVFPWFMLLGSTIFFEPDWPRRVGLMKKHELDQVPAPPGEPSRAVRLGLRALGVYAILQLLVPLRLHLYPGRPEWTYEGHRFAWRMKLAHKQNTKLRFVTTNPATREVLVIPVERNLPAFQRNTMATRPDMILEYVHQCDALQREQGFDFEIRAESEVALNGRSPRPLIDRSVDLTEVKRGLGHAEWILPLKD